MGWLWIISLITGLIWDVSEFSRPVHTRILYYVFVCVTHFNCAFHNIFIFSLASISFKKSFEMFCCFYNQFLLLFLSTLENMFFFKLPFYIWTRIGYCSQLNCIISFLYILRVDLEKKTNTIQINLNFMEQAECILLLTLNIIIRFVSFRFNASYDFLSNFSLPSTVAFIFFLKHF